MRIKPLSSRPFTLLALGFLLGWQLSSTQAQAAPKGFLETIHRHAMLASTSPGNGDLNPYAIYVVPQDMGSLKKNEVLVTNFNNVNNLQGTGTTIVAYSPVTKSVRLFASAPAHLAACPPVV